MIAIISGVVAAFITILLLVTLPKYFSVKLLSATILVAIAFIYVGFSLKDNTAWSIVLEVAAALVFYFMALIGYTRNIFLLAYGIMLHGAWDFLHHDGLVIGTDIPAYWPLFCAIIDIIVGLYLLLVFRKQNKS